MSYCSSLPLNIWQHFVSLKRRNLVLYFPISQQTLGCCTRTNVASINAVNNCLHTMYALWFWLTLKQYHVCSRIQSLFNWWMTTLPYSVHSCWLQTRRADSSLDIFITSAVFVAVSDDSVSDEVASHVVRWKRLTWTQIFEWRCHIDLLSKWLSGKAGKTFWYNMICTLEKCAKCISLTDYAK